MSNKDKILDIISNLDEEIINYDGDNLYDAGIIDSMMVIDIVTEIEDQFDIEIDAELVVAENFANLETILNFVLPLIEEA